MKKLNKINYPIYALNNESDLISKEKGLDMQTKIGVLVKLHFYN